MNSSHRVQDVDAGIGIKTPVKGTSVDTTAALVILNLNNSLPY
ncbi:MULTISPECIES: hypothetical protein [Actinomyces]|nr:MULTISPECIES: hypothetical protein [Actinomyces]